MQNRAVYNIGIPEMPSLASLASKPLCLRKMDFAAPTDSFSYRPKS